ncbi:hypothetical protein H0H93_006958, partial [Arthromyces matolae]
YLDSTKFRPPTIMTITITSTPTSPSHLKSSSLSSLLALASCRSWTTNMMMRTLSLRTISTRNGTP